MKRLLPGPNAVSEALKAAPSNIEVIYLAENLNSKTATWFIKEAKSAKVPWEQCSRDHLDTVAPDVNHQGIVAITGSFSFVDLDSVLGHAEKQDDPLLIILDQIQDPGNLGAIVRSSHALGAAGIIITKDRSATMTSAAVRASAGASELVKMARVTNLVQCLNALKNTGYRVYGAAGESQTMLDKVDWSGKIALVLGNEGKGLRRLTRENCDDLYAIPMPTGFESLNVSAAAAISIYEVGRSRKP